MKGKIERQRSAIKAALYAAVAFGMFGMSAARADYVPCETPFASGIPLASLAQEVAGSSIDTTQLVWGKSLTVNAMSIAGPGTLTVKLTDIEWPEALSSLDLLVTDLNGIWQRWEGEDLLIDIDGPAKLFAAVFATSSGPQLPGLYHLRADFAAAAVPLPAGVWLLLSAIGGLAAFRRKS